MTLDENDYLTFQLYTASKTPRVKRTRIRSWILTTVTFACLAYLFYNSDNDFLGIYFLVITGLSLTLFPFYTRWRYKRHYIKYIRDTYKNRFGEKCDLEFDNDTIVTKDKSGEVKINKSEIEEINEIKDFYFIKTRTGTTLIISKNKTDDIEKIKNEIKSLIETRGLKHNIELDWKWR